MEITATPLATLALALAFSLIQSPIILTVAHSFGWYDPASPRKLHREPVPRLGGVAIFSGFSLALLLIALTTPAPFRPVSGDVPLWPFLLGAFLIHITGVLDDFQDLRARHKLLVQLLAALLLVASGYRFQGLAVPWSDTPLPFGPLAAPISMAWIIGVTNALNLLDGLDGLAGSVAVVAAATFGTLFLVNGNVAGACVAFALCGAVLGFLWFNWHPARLFMGDGGSLLVGFVLAGLPLLSQADGTLELGFATSVLVLGIPVLDTLHVMGHRLRAGRPVMSGDQGHVHHQLLRLGLGVRGTVAALTATALVASLTALGSTLLSPRVGCTLRFAALGLLALALGAVHLWGRERGTAAVRVSRD